MEDETKDTNSTTEGTTVEAKLAGLEEALARKEAELNESRTKVASLESTLQVRESEMTATRKSADEAQGRLSVTGKALAEAITGYRTLALQLNPGVTEDLITGGTVAAIDESLAKAKTLIGRVRQSVEKEIAEGRVPIGSPGRQPPDLASLTPREKINYAIGGKK